MTVLALTSLLLLLLLKKYQHWKPKTFLLSVCPMLILMLFELCYFVKAANPLVLVTKLTNWIRCVI